MRKGMGHTVLYNTVLSEFGVQVLSLLLLLFIIII